LKEKEKKRLDDWYVFLLAIATLKQMYERNLFQSVPKGTSSTASQVLQESQHTP
jgi:hypothetical protein